MKKSIFILTFLIFSQIASPQTVRFMVLGDIHHPWPSTHINSTFLYEFSMAAIAEKVDFIFFTGDLEISYINPEEEKSVLEEWRWMFDTLSNHNIKLYACRGNTDEYTPWEVVFSGDYGFPRNGPENEKGLTYAIEYENMLFIAFDQYIYPNENKINQAWLDELLKKNSKEHIFVAGHAPAFNINKTGTLSRFPEDRDLFWESLSQAGAKAYFCGHEHFYDHAIIGDGDGNPQNDIHQIISGTGEQGMETSYGYGKEYNGKNGRWTPHRIFHEKANGYVLVSIDASDVRITWKRRNGRNDFREGGDNFRLPWTGAAIQRTESPFKAIRVFPGPDRKSLTIHLPFVPPPYTAFEILDICGKTISVNPVPAGNARYILNLSYYQKGNYFIRIGNFRIKPIFHLN